MYFIIQGRTEAGELVAESLESPAPTRTQSEATFLCCIKLGWGDSTTAVYCLSLCKALDSSSAPKNRSV